VEGGGVAQLAVDGAAFWVAEESPANQNFSPESLGGCSVRMLLIAADPAAVCARAVAAGATQVAPVTDEYGWRLGRIVDPFGHHWEVGRPLDESFVLVACTQAPLPLPEGPMQEPTISLPSTAGAAARTPFSATGGSFVIHEWRGSGPALLHVHHADDEAWHVLEGTLRFRFADRTADVPAGGTVFVPAGVPHTYEAIDARYLIVLTPRLDALIRELQRTPDRAAHAAVYRMFESELLE
jgi:hypothetical protein